MRLAFLAPEFLPYIGGVGIYSINLVKELSKCSELDIHVFTPMRGKDYDRNYVLNYFGHCIKLHNISLASDDFVYNFAFQYQVFRQLPRYHEKYRYDLIHAANLANMPDVFLKFRPLQIPVITTVHTTVNGQVHGSLMASRNPCVMSRSEIWSLAAYPFISILERLYRNRSKYFITVSRKFEEILRRGYNFDGIIAPIHNGVDLELYNCEMTGDPYQKFPELKDKGPIVLYAGRLIARKGLDLHAEAISRLKDTGAHFVFAGRGSERLLSSALKKHGIREGAYTYLGFVPREHLPSVYRLSSIFVLPSYYENFPFSLLEAMAMKVPCVASNVGAVDEIIDDGVNGLLFPAGDLESLVRHLKTLLNDETKRLQIGEAGHRKVVSQFTSARMAEKHLEFYWKVLGGAYGL